MSKIEKALSRARRERGNLPVPVTGTAGATQGPGTALVADPVGHGSLVSSETITRMSEPQLLSAEELLQRGIIHPERADDTAVQVFRELRTKILQQSQGRNSVILVSGVKERSGSSFVAQNLGAAFALDTGKTALVIDCNLKNPSMHRLISNASVLGLTDYLENPDIDLSEIIHPVGIMRYRVITAGGRREIPGEYFTSPRMTRLIESVRRRYGERFIILDGPPMSDFADVQMLSELCDYVIVVARYALATKADIDNCLNTIQKKLLGIVFNDEPRIPWMRQHGSRWWGGGLEPRGQSGG
jgi:capsular exopolysaccharide synthesis family protein